MKHRTRTTFALAALLALTTACSSDETTAAPAPSESVEITAEATDDAPTKEERIAAAENAPGKAADAAAAEAAATAAEEAETARQVEAIEAAEAQKIAEAQDAADDAALVGALDLTTDEGLCAADAELTNLEVNDALAPLLGFSADRDVRTFDQTEAIREHKNLAFSRACPERMS